MQSFFSIGKILTLGFWVLPVLAILGLFPGAWNDNMLIITAVVFLAHLGELALFYGKLKAKGHGGAYDILMVILVGLFHWMPLLKQPEAEKS